MKVFLSMFACCCFVLPQETNAQYEATINSLFRDWDTTNAPGGVVAVVQQDCVMYRKAFGLADLQKGTSITPAMSFNLASLAKQFTATCIALLEEAGKLSVETRLSQYYPDFPFADRVKVRHLLDHTSGIREAYVLAVLSGKMNLRGQLPRKYQTKDYLLGMLTRQTDLNYPPGEVMVYTNVNYILLGDIVEKVSGRSLRQFADSAIFQPLGMMHTFFRDTQDTVVANETPGYHYTGKRFKREAAVGGVVGDHNLVSTLDDLILWVKNFDNNALGSKNSTLIEKLTRSSRLNNGNLTDYGYGLWTNEYRGLRQLYHGGDNGQHTSFILRFPDQDLSIIVLANASRYDDTQRKAYHIADVLLKEHLEEKAPPPSSYAYVNLHEEVLTPKVGLYQMIDEQGLAQIRKVSFVEGSLYISDAYHHRGLPLRPVTPDFFVAKNPLGKYLRLTFTPTSDGLTVREQYEDNAWEFTQVKDLSIDYEDYGGRFVNESVDAQLTVKSRKNKIFAQRGIIKIPLVPIGEDTFYGTQIEGRYYVPKRLSRSGYPAYGNGE